MPVDMPMVAIVLHGLALGVVSKLNVLWLRVLHIGALSCCLFATWLLLIFLAGKSNQPASMSHA